MKFFWAFWRRPFDDVMNGLESSLDVGVPGLVRVFGGLFLGWWIYVPLHELLHALGCLLTGGSVERLEISPLYGGAVLAKFFPFVVAGGEYAGRLAGFDTGGSDLVYLATDLAPFVLTLPGIWLLLWAGKRGRGLTFGFSLPFALAPFLSLTGDAYEIGSILTTRLPFWRTQLDLLRGDDLFKIASTLSGSPAAPWSGYVLAVLIGVIWAWATYGLCRWAVQPKNEKLTTDD